MEISYKSAGVDIDKADAIKENIKKIASGTLKSIVIHGVGPFAAVAKLPAGFIVATCDGVGTKIAIAQEFNRIEGLGYDLVAMNVNDILAMHGKPLLFLDYIGVPNLETINIEKLISSIASACIEADCSLVGGETAQMPGFYEKNRFELVGFCIGIVKKLPQKNKISEGDVILAFPSNGPHSNGYSLIRKLIEEKLINPEDRLKRDKLIDVILRPTRIYVNDFFEIVKEFGYPKASANITGGGIPGNLSRIIPEKMTAAIDKKSLEYLSENFADGIFSHISRFVPEKEMIKVFNMGAGFVMIYPKKKAQIILEKMKGKVFKIGSIEKWREEKVVIE